MVIEVENARTLMSGLPEDMQDFIDGDIFGGGNAVDPPTADDPGLGGGSGDGGSGDSGSGGSNTPPPEIHETSPAPEPMPSNPPGTEPPPYEGDTGASDDSGGDQGGSAPQPEDSNQDGGYFIGELTDDPDPEETDIMDVLETGTPGEGTMVLTGRKKVEQEPVTEQPEPAPSPELVENYWLKGGLLVAIAIIVCLLFQNPRRKKS